MKVFINKYTTAEPLNSNGKQYDRLKSYGLVSVGDVKEFYRNQGYDGELLINYRINVKKSWKNEETGQWNDQVIENIYFQIPTNIGKENPSMLGDIKPIMEMMKMINSDELKGMMEMFKGKNG